MLRRRDSALPHSPDDPKGERRARDYRRRQLRLKIESLIDAFDRGEVDGFMVQRLHPAQPEAHVMAFREQDRHVVR